MRSSAPVIALLIGLAVLLAAGGGSSVCAKPAPPSDGQPLKKPQIAPPPPRAPVKPAKAPLARLPVVFAPPKASPIPTDTGDCRLACGQGYYFCLAGDEPDSCSGPWTACLSACSRPADAPGARGY